MLNDANTWHHGWAEALLAEENQPVSPKLVALALVIAAVWFVLWALGEGEMMSKQTNVAVRARFISRALMSYTETNDDRFPPVMRSAADIRPLVAPYIDGDKSQPWDNNGPRHSAWAFNYWLESTNAKSIRDPEHTLVVFDSEDWKNGVRCAGFADGHGMRVRGFLVEQAMVERHGVVSVDRSIR